DGDETVRGIGFPEEVARHLGQAAEACFPFAQAFLRLLALQELPHLAADDARRLLQALVRRAYLAAGKGQHADGFARRDDGECETSLPRVDVSRPHGLARLPDRA